MSARRDPVAGARGAAGLAKLGYGALFVVLWPAVLVAVGRWVRVPFPAVSAPLAGAVAASLGLAIVGAGVVQLWTRGHGLPMNAFPPRDLVTTGVFALLPHPIYVGFCLAVAGVAIGTGSPSGLWVALPVTVVGCLALVLGHERLSLLGRFGRLPRPLLGPGRLLPLARALRLDAAVRLLLDAVQRLANGWGSVRIGPVRVLNHVVFSGLAGGVGAALVVLAAGSDWTPWVVALMLAGALGAALIGQVLVGSSDKLSRPFGYFGGLVAITVLGLSLLVWRPDAVVLLGAFCLAAPWTQALGRLRCLVQGCCHGAPAPAASGIVVTNPHSRVCGLAGLGGRPIHATQFYSILGNLLLGPVLAGAWLAGAPVTLVIDGYLIGAGAIRFVEEAYRGEPLTRVVAGLRVYQWFAVGMFVAGVVALLVPSASAPPPDPAAWPAALGVGSAFFVICGAAMSVDLPDSRARFSRLSG